MAHFKLKKLKLYQHKARFHIEITDAVIICDYCLNHRLRYYTRLRILIEEDVNSFNQPNFSCMSMETNVKIQNLYIGCPFKLDLFKTK
jgi:hypothetical protein